MKLSTYNLKSLPHLSSELRKFPVALQTKFIRKISWENLKKRIKNKVIRQKRIFGELTI